MYREKRGMRIFMEISELARRVNHRGVGKSRKTNRGGGGEHAVLAMIRSRRLMTNVELSGGTLPTSVFFSDHNFFITSGASFFARLTLFSPFFSPLKINLCDIAHFSTCTILTL